ncbi:D-amino-acid transaminase [Rhodopseudomonas sp. P2A-2r]|uniref:D-amino-acid transaminase n=1 Tax=unclassified Rhodopseudomonas TaxID=2638247 RepID=UPI0022342E28|nr:D-amino-acid transaminase [Rhodopseudomonas sp. P2A-2r]UZE46846.1 D-amino-acid transaminase [Rhodopseudomonas sp. P2A-2r]
MSRIAYVNGHYQNLRDAAVNVEDRGYQFADGIYEVCEIIGGKMVDFPRHMARMQRSLRELRMAEAMPLASLKIVMQEVIRRNRISYGIVYLQISRGVAHRDHGFPSPEVKPSLVITAKSLNFAKNQAQAARGVKVITTAENRWPRVDIKTVGLLPNVLARQEARDKGAYEAWYVDADGFVTEGASCNAWIVTRDGKVVTRSAERGILSGITRAVLIEVLESLQLKLEERNFTPEEAYQAAEAFVSSASQIVMPVISIDGKTIGDGKPGAIATRLREEFHRFSAIS